MKSGICTKKTTVQNHHPRDQTCGRHLAAHRMRRSSTPAARYSETHRAKAPSGATHPSPQHRKEQLCPPSPPSLVAASPPASTAWVRSSQVSRLTATSTCGRPIRHFGASTRRCCSPSWATCATTSPSLPRVRVTWGATAWRASTSTSWSPPAKTVRRQPSSSSAPIKLARPSRTTSSST